MLYQQDAARAIAVQAQQSEPMLQGLGAYIRSNWDEAYRAKERIEWIMLKALRARNREYEPDKLAAIKQQGGTQMYLGITDNKCRGAASWIRDIMLEDGTPPWDIKPTPIPQLAPHHMQRLEQAFADKVMSVIEARGTSIDAAEMAVMREKFQQDYQKTVAQEAANCASRMKLKIADQFAEGGWSEAVNAFISDFVTLPCAFLKGPVVHRRRVRRNVTENGKTVQKVEMVLVPEFKRVDPFHIYPEPGIENIADGYLFEHHMMTRMDLAALLDVPGYDRPVIEELLKYGPPPTWLTGRTQHEREQAQRKYNAHENRVRTYEALEFWGQVSGRDLLEWGMNPANIPDPARMYDANVWMVGNYVLKAVLNYDPLGKKPYVKSSFSKAVGAFWGRGIPEMIEDIQATCNGIARALINNIAIASGPIVEVNISRWPANQPLQTLRPWLMIQTTASTQGAKDPALHFNQPRNDGAENRSQLEFWIGKADDHSGIPPYLSGNIEVGGASRTAAGLSMLMGAAGKGIRDVVMYIDQDVIKPVVEAMFNYNMRFDQDESIKGDAQIVAQGAFNLANQATDTLRMQELLRDVAGNPLLAKVFGEGGMSALARQVVKGLNMPTDDIVPTREAAAVNALIEQQVAELQAREGGLQAPTEGNQATHPDGSAKGGAQSNATISQ